MTDGMDYWAYATHQEGIIAPCCEDMRTLISTPLAIRWDEGVPEIGLLAGNYRPIYFCPFCGALVDVAYPDYPEDKKVAGNPVSASQKGN